jgi:polyphosphate kinase 2
MPGMKKKDYEALLEPLHVELNQMARWLQNHGKRVVVVFEGRDTAGKGGVISAISRHASTRASATPSLSAKPSEREKGQWYFQRYVPHLPAAGEIALFDRSWYNRAGVERVMGFCNESAVTAFLKQAPAVRAAAGGRRHPAVQVLAGGAIRREQEERFAERVEDPVKRWKLSPIDLKAREKYAEYGHARDAMFEATHSQRAPWTVVDFNDQKIGRLTLIRDLLDRLPDHAVAEEAIDLPPLKGKPGKEKYAGPVKPIRSRY